MIGYSGRNLSKTRTGRYGGGGSGKPTTVEVVSGSTPHGQGHDTAWSQIVADQLGVPFEDVTVLHGDTRVSVKGMDTYGSRSLAVGGIAMVNAAEKVRDKARKVAAHLMEVSPTDLEWSGGAFRVRGNPDQSKSIPELAIAVFAAHNLPDGVEASLDSEATFDPSTFSFPHGTHLCAAEVDTETGRVTIRKYVAVDDVGRVIVPGRVLVTRHSRAPPRWRVSQQASRDRSCVGTRPHR